MFLNREQAEQEEVQARIAAEVQVAAQLAMLQLRNEMLESLLRTYGNRIIELEVRLALAEAAQKKE